MSTDYRQQAQQVISEVMSALGSRTYVGGRYVPVFAEPLGWRAETTYEPLTYVRYNEYLYISKHFVPAGISPLNDSYWALVSMGQSGGGGDTDGMRTYGTLQELLEDTTISSGDVCRTLGYYEPLDDGGSTYVISASGTPDGVAVLETDNGSIATLVYEGSMCPVQFGAHPLDPNTSPDTITDDMLSDEAFFYMLSADIAIDGRNRGYGIRNLVVTGNIADVRNCALILLAPVSITSTNLINFDNVKVNSRYITGIASTYALTIDGYIIRIANSTFDGSNRVISCLNIKGNYCVYVAGCSFKELVNAIYISNYETATIVVQNCFVLSCSTGVNTRVGKTYVLECIFSSCVSYGIYAASSSGFLCATNCYFDSCYIGIYGATALGNAFLYAYIVGNYIYRCSNRNSCAILMYRTTVGSTIAHNTIRDCAGSGIRTDASIVADNYIYNVGNAHPAYTYDYGEAIRLDSLTGNPIEVHGNVISGCWKYGIMYLQSAGTDAQKPQSVVIRDNNISGVVADGDTQLSIFVSDNQSSGFARSRVVLRDNVSDYPMYSYAKHIDTDNSIPPVLPLGVTPNGNPMVVVPRMSPASLSDVMAGVDQIFQPSLGQFGLYLQPPSGRTSETQIAYCWGESVAIKLCVSSGSQGMTLEYTGVPEGEPSELSLPSSEDLDYRPLYMVLPPCYGPIWLIGAAGQSVLINEVCIQKTYTIWDGQLPPSSHFTQDYPDTV